MRGLVVAGVLAFVSFIVTVLVTEVIWPGEAKLTAPLFCADGMPDAFVVLDTTSIEPGETSYSYSLYCMGPGGQTEEIGFFRLSVVLTVAHGALVVVLVDVVVLALRPRRAPRASPL